MMASIAAEYDVSALDALLERVYRHGGYDFREYKRGTVTRRLARRLHYTGVNTYREYMQFLDAHPEEYQKFAEDITIKVSGFFRSQYAFKQVAGVVLPALLAYKEAHGERAIRFWSVACARGEEPYSMAVLLHEFLGKRLNDFDVSIYATDISRWALAEAQAAIYSLKDIEGLPENILESYFRRGEDYELRDDIKQMVNFSCFDLASASQAAFDNVDCIFCCNVLIYWQKKLQERVLKMLYDALAIPGYLVLGEVETPTNNMRERLVCLDGKAKIYRKRAD